ncbi:hypothetical protein ABNIH1_06917 [Acinetobacter baumannii ABNIH1]|nr:hypothetical protein ABNIH1_06917 [Acinetobacter baumannii ABNIH1]
MLHLNESYKDQPEQLQNSQLQSYLDQFEWLSIFQFD